MEMAAIYRGTLKRERKNSTSADLQMFLMFMVLTIQGCDLLNPLPSCDRREPAGWESARRRSVTFIFSRLLGLPGQSDKRETSCPQWRGMYQRAFEGLVSCWGGKVGKR